MKEKIEEAKRRKRKRGTDRQMKRKETNKKTEKDK